MVPINANQGRIKFEIFILALYFILTPFEHALYFEHGTVLKFVAALFGGIVLFRFMFVNKTYLKLTSIILLPLLLIALSYFSLLWSIDVEQSIRMSQTYLFLKLMFIMVYITKYNDKEVKLLKDSIVLGAVLSCIYLLFISPDLLFESTTNRLAMHEADPNEFAAFLFLPFFIVLGRIIDKWSFIKIGILGAILLTILLTGSRGAMLSIVIAALIFLLAKYRMNRIISYAFLAILVVIIVRTFLPEFILDRLWFDSRILEEFLFKEGRTYIYHIVFTRIIPDMPILGFGSGNFGAALLPYFGHVVGTHNTFLSVLLEYGILGLPLLLLFLYKIFKRIRLEGDYTKISVFIAILIAVFFLDAFFKKYFWNVLMFVVITSNYFNIAATNFKMKNNKVSI